MKMGSHSTVSNLATSWTANKQANLGGEFVHHFTGTTREAAAAATAPKIPVAPNAEVLTAS
jgi:hypothetical protein